MLASADETRSFAERVLCAAGLDPEDAGIVADGLALANLRGVDSHGVLILRLYVRALQAGHINRHARIRVVERRGATAVIDADGGFGYRPSIFAVDLAVELARETGAAVIGVRNSRHYGMAASYTIRAAEAGAIALITTTAAAMIAPPGGRTAVTGNNPIACAIPRQPPNPPISLDMALSEVAFGKIRLAWVEGRSIPPNWAFDDHGRPTTDPAAAMKSKLIAPIGRHKGFGLSVIAEVLAGALTDSAIGTDTKGLGGAGCGHIVIAIEPSYFLNVARFYESVERLVSQIKAVPLADDAEAVYLPGEPEWNTMQRRELEGIPVSDELAADLQALALELNVTAPIWM